MQIHRWLFLFPIGQQSYLNMNQHHDIHARDFVRYGDVTLNVTYRISGSSADKSMICLWPSRVTL